MTTEGRISRLEGTYEQVNERLGDYVERFADISGRIEGVREEIGALRSQMNANNAALREEIGALRSEMNANNAALRNEMNANNAALRSEMNANNAALRNEMNANIAGVRRENRWIGGIIIAGIIATVISVIIPSLL